jgi:LuxR family maltose regulon positive regulatory protein
VAATIQANTLLTLVRPGQAERVEAALAGLNEQQCASAAMRAAVASLRLAQHDPKAVATALAPLLGGSVTGVRAVWMVTALLLEAIARDAFGDQGAAERALERALDVAGPDRVLIPFLVHRAPGLLERHARHATAHAALISEILACSPGRAGQPHRQANRAACASRSARPRALW